MSRTLFTSKFGGDLKVATNRDKLRQSLSLSALHFMRQTHSDRVLVVDESGGDFDCDAIITASRSVGIAALAADCMPITFAATGLVGVAHVGRVGLVKEIAPRVVAQMRELGAGEISAIIGPSICANCYEVSPEMYEDVVEQISETQTSRERHALDLQSGAIAQLQSLGVVVRNVGICTREDPNYFSFRGGDLTERQVGLISL